MSEMIGERMTRILDSARWAPSGDNTQPWRFEVEGDSGLIIHGSDTRDWCVYDLQGRASQIAVGALLENIAIASSREGLRVHFELLPASMDQHPLIRAIFTPSEALPTDPLHAVLEQRSTQRRPMAWTALRPADRAALESSLGPGYRVVWVEGTGPKMGMARLLFLNAKIRLTIQEGYEVHRRIIEWDSGFSEDRIPDRALGLNPLAVALMKWAMVSWARVDFLNRYLAGSVLPRIEMDALPALACAAHFFIVADSPPEQLQDYLHAGRAMQRFWLTTTALGLQFQPEMTPLIFSVYARDGVRFTQRQTALQTAATLRNRLGELIGPNNLNAAVFAGRIGYGPAPRWRSLRLPVAQLLRTNTAK